MTELQRYYEECCKGEYADVHDKASTIWHQKLWNPSRTRTCIFNLVNENQPLFRRTNPFITRMGDSCLMQRLADIFYNTGLVPMDDDARKLFDAAMKGKEHYDYLYGTTVVAKRPFNWRHPFQSRKKRLKIQADYYTVHMQVSDAHVKTKERIVNNPNSMYNGELEGICDATFEITLYSKLHQGAIAKVFFPTINGLRVDPYIVFTKEGEKEPGYFGGLSLDIPDKAMTPINVWMASICDDVLKFEEELYEQMTKYVVAYHKENAADANDLSAWLDEHTNTKEAKKCPRPII